jgi:glycosyltransferase involved in cell wall biosynthesis
MTRTRGWHVAFHSLGCVLAAAGEIRVPSLDGPMIEAMADVCDRLTIVAYDPPAAPRDASETVDYALDLAGRSVDVLSLGPMGTWRDALGRSRRLAPLVAEASGSWDVLVVWLQNRRIGAVVDPSRCPRLVVIDGTVIGDEAKSERLPLRTKLLRRAIADVTERIGDRAIRRAGLVVVNSAMLADRHRRLNDNVVVHRWTRRRSSATFVSPDRFQAPAVNVLIAGRVTPYKGVFEGLEVFARLKHDGLPDAHLHIAGEGPSVADLRGEVSRRGLDDAVTFHGWLSGDALFSLYARSDVLLHLSYAESFPRVVLEALAHSVPVVCTPVGGLRDTLADGRDVLYVEPKTVDPAIDAVRRLASDGELRRSLISTGFEAARESAVDEFVRRVAASISATWPELAPTEGSERRST